MKITVFKLRSKFVTCQRCQLHYNRLILDSLTLNVSKLHGVKTSSESKLEAHQSVTAGAISSKSVSSSVGGFGSLS